MRAAPDLFGVTTAPALPITSGDFAIWLRTQFGRTVYDVIASGVDW